MSKEQRPSAQRGRLLFVAPSAYLLGGVQTWLDYILPGLSEKGWHVDLALSSGAHHDTKAYLARHPFKRAHIVEAPTGAQMGRVHALVELVTRIGPDIVVGVNIADVYSAVAHASKGAVNVKSVATLHGLQPDFLADFQYFSSCIDAIICTNRLAERIVRAETAKGSMEILYAPYGVDEVSPVERTGNKSKIRLGYVGRIENDQKRIDDLVDIVGAGVSAGVDMELLVAGNGPDEASMRESVTNRGLDRHVTLLGVVDPLDLSEKVYGRCDVLIITSLWETGPIVAWEAMMREITVLTSAYIGSGAEGALRDGETCLMFPIGGIDAAIDRLRLAPDGLRERVAKAGRALARSRYSKDCSIGQWDECLRAVMAMPAKPKRAPRPLRGNGRLDRLLGVEFGEAVRKKLGRTYRHDEPGGEWPHAYGEGAMSADAFWRLAARLDRVSETV